jgi:predicted nucleic acid-binding protein
MRRFLFDTAVFVHAFGDSHPLREPCRDIVDRQSNGRLSGEMASTLIQEFAHQRLRQLRDRAAAVVWARKVAALCRVHPIRESDAMRALELYERHPRLDAMDAIFAAVALVRGIDAILTPDRGFDRIPGLERVDPLDSEAVAALGE